jgi:phage RecT family recombinase
MTAPNGTQEERRVALEHREELLEYIGKYGEEIEKLAPRDRFGQPTMNADFYVASLRLYFAQNPKLLECKPLSIANGILRVAQTGLTLGVSCDLLPFKSVCQYSPRYTGICELALASGVRAINLGVVREGDYFKYMKGTNSFVEHQPIGKSKAPILYGYAIAEIKQGAFSLEVMTAEAIDAHRQRYSRSWWLDDNKKVIPLEEIPWYGKKTPLRQLSNVLPKSPRLAAALIYEKQADEEEIPEAEFEVEEPRRQPADAREPTYQNDRGLDDFPGRGR